MSIINSATNKILTAVVTAAVVMTPAGVASAAISDPDASFNANVAALGFNSEIYSVSELPDGRLLVSGNFTSPTHKVAVLQADGTLDNSFTPPSGVFDAAHVQHSMARQVNGQTKILVAGSYRDFSGWKSFDQLEADGRLDQTFRDNLTAGNWEECTSSDSGGIQAVAVQADNKILLSGKFGVGPDMFTRCNEMDPLLRLNSDGTLDTSFYANVTNFSWGVEPEVKSIVLEPDGQILVSGRFTSPGRAIARLNSDGTRDTAFNDQVSSDALVAEDKHIHSMVVDSDTGTIFGAGNFFGSPQLLASFNADGTLNAGFNANVGTTLGAKSAVKIAFDSSGGLYVAGSFTDVYYNGGFNGDHDLLARFNLDGTVDTSFTPSINDGGGRARSMFVQSSNHVLLAGRWDSPQRYLERFEGAPQPAGAPTAVTATAGDGQVDLSWTAPSSNGGADISGYRIQIRSNGNWSTSVEDTGNTNTTHTISGLLNGLPVQFRVAAINNIGVGNYSTGSTAVTPAEPTPEPPAPEPTPTAPAPPPNNPPVANPPAPAPAPPANNPPATTPPAPTTPPVAATAPGKIAKAKVKAKKSKKGKRKYLLKITAPADNGGSEVTAYEFRIKAKAKQTGKKIKAKWTDWQSFKTAAQTAKMKKAVNKLRKYPRGTKVKMQIRAVNSVGPGPATSVKTKTR